MRTQRDVRKARMTRNDSMLGTTLPDKRLAAISCCNSSKSARLADIPTLLRLCWRSRDLEIRMWPPATHLAPCVHACIPAAIAADANLCIVGIPDAQASAVTSSQPPLVTRSQARNHCKPCLWSQAKRATPFAVAHRVIRRSTYTLPDSLRLPESALFVPYSFIRYHAKALILEAPCVRLWLASRA